ncbi:tRNA (adenosine(37)-N6)-threonylcarbamoyltransferase complex dimerization subunit type 1 TsaB [Kineococcus sp. SYSU DK004]|uniref:tRNA (adenosine(37)-N6)-threonylcarbamoyltransferase complex dimerization subunit type 1 TsaB n=1 Tax=Kineococcus sp. SYSU DK004 TaxID=3383125 RepID=UPI003D7CD6DA
MLLLALDTATDGVAVAVCDGERVLASRRAGDARHHNEVLAPTVAAVLAEAGAARADVTDVAVGVGPGPYTGLRVGLVTAQALALAWGARPHGVCSLDAIAADAVERGTVRAGAGEPVDFLVATDARRREVHTARYRLDPPGDGGEALAGLHRTAGPDVVAPAAVERGGLPVVGRGTLLHPDALGPAAEPFDVDAGALARVAVLALAGRTSLPLLPVEPLYLRRPDAVVPAGPKRVTG